MRFLAVFWVFMVGVFGCFTVKVVLLMGYFILMTLYLYKLILP